MPDVEALSMETVKRVVSACNFKLLKSPPLNCPTLKGIRLEIRESILRRVIERNDDTPWCIGRGHGQHARATVDDTKVPRAASVVDSLVWSDEGLTFVILDDVCCSVLVLLV
ncbi:hypothetical protein HG531_001384 [Fusarium graminearum]|nr:hypothetical protein HG531_001384 [Fusarium graminearum]